MSHETCCDLFQRGVTKAYWMNFSKILCSSIWSFVLALPRLTCSIQISGSVWVCAEWIVNEDEGFEIRTCSKLTVKNTNNVFTSLGLPNELKFDGFAQWVKVWWVCPMRQNLLDLPVFDEFFNDFHLKSWFSFEWFLLVNLAMQSCFDRPKFDSGAARTLSI